MSESPPADWHFSVLAPFYDLFAVQKDYKSILEGLDLTAGDRLLDLGGGTGTFCSELTERDAIARDDCYVLDKSRAMLGQALEKELPHLVEGDATNLPFATGSLDAVFMGDTLHHMGRRTRVLQEVSRVLSAEGRLVIEEFDPGTILGKCLEWFERLSGMGSEFFTPDELIRMVVGAGLEVRRIKRDGFVYLLTARSNQ